MNLDSLVEKITREVMENVKSKGSPPETHRSTWDFADKDVAVSNKIAAFPVSSVKSDALLLAGSPCINGDMLKEAVSYLRSRNMRPAVAVCPDAPSVNLEGVQIFRCNSLSDCAGALGSASTVVILLPDISTVSRLANLIVDRFDLESAVAGLERGCQVWALKFPLKLPAGLKSRVGGFFSEIEKMGIEVASLSSCGASCSGVCDSVAAVWTKPEKDSSSMVCSASDGSDCAGCGLCASLAHEKVKSVVEEGADRVSAAPGIPPVSSNIAAMIDHTLLKPDATREQILKLCQEAKEYSFASCCVNPVWVSTVAECLKGSPVKTCVVIGFPLGANSPVVKAMETRDAAAAGADEVDMVINVGALKAGDYDLVRRDIQGVVEAAQGRIVKVILETALLNDDEKIRACQLSKQAGADFVKTSTGFGPGGATAEDIALMRKTVGKYMGVKASGGIRDFAKAQEMIKAGATRIGASASVAIVKAAAGGDPSGY